jgi:hypothetical protein
MSACIARLKDSRFAKKKKIKIFPRNCKTQRENNSQQPEDGRK